MKEYNLPKNASPKRTDRMVRENSKKVLACLMVLIALLGIGRVGFIIFVKGSEYRSIAEQNQLYDQAIPAVRGTIYDCNMTPLVTSSTAWILTVDPWSIYNYFKKNYKDKVVDENNETTYDYTKAEKKYQTYAAYIGEEMASVLDIDKSDLVSILSTPFKDDESKIQYKIIKKEVTATERIELDKIFASSYELHAERFYTEEEIKEAEKKGEETKYLIASSFFNYEEDNIRIYPENNFASTIIGVTNYDGDGLTGIEAQYNTQLKGVDGRRVTAKDGKGNAIDSSYETVIDAEEGNGVVLTIDSNIQMYLENALSQALEEYDAQGTYGIVMDVETGAILAMSNKPDFDLNDAYTIVNEEDAIAEVYAEAEKNNEEITETQARTRALYNQWNSYCITNTYEPGSTFKIFTASAAIEEKEAELTTQYTCTGGYKISDSVIIHCANTSGHGTQTLTEGLMNSCNPFFIDLGEKLGAKTYYKYFEAFGFTETTGIDLPSEAKPAYHTEEELKVTELASTSFGQSFRISPIQLLTATCAIANGGKLMQPYIVDSIVDTEGNIISKTEPQVKRQVISEETASTVRDMMEAVVEAGTGKAAYIEGYRVAGKTATSEKLDDEEKRDQMVYVASFVCFAPADDPKVAILVGVDEPSGEYKSGGSIAAPMAKQILIPTLKYLNVEPQYTESELEEVQTKAPDLVGETVTQAKIDAAQSSFTVKTIGSGDTVISQVPAANQSIPSEGIIVVYTDDSTQSETTEVPDFKGMTASQANTAAHEAGINIVLSGPSTDAGAVIYSQSSSAGEKIAYGSSVTVYFRVNTQE